MVKYEAYVHHGSGTAGPFRTEKCPVRYRPTQSTRPSGPIASNYEVRVHSHWLRLFVSSGFPENFIRLGGNVTRVNLLEVKPNGNR